MGGAASSGGREIVQRATDEPDFHAELVRKPREVLERELDRPLTDEELQQAADELKKHGIHVQLPDAEDGADKGD
jgi:hypothetical protein